MLVVQHGVFNKIDFVNGLNYSIHSMKYFKLDPGVVLPQKKRKKKLETGHIAIFHIIFLKQELPVP